MNNDYEIPGFLTVFVIDNLNIVDIICLPQIYVVCKSRCRTLAGLLMQNKKDVGHIAHLRNN